MMPLLCGVVLSAGAEEEGGAGETAGGAKRPHGRLINYLSHEIYPLVRLTFISYLFCNAALNSLLATPLTDEWLNFVPLCQRCSIPLEITLRHPVLPVADVHVAKKNKSCCKPHTEHCS